MVMEGKREGPVAVTRAQCRDFFYSLYGDANPDRRRSFIKQWQKPKKKSASDTLCDTLAETISGVLYGPVAFKMRAESLCLLGAGDDAFSIRYTAAKFNRVEQDFIVRVFSNRNVLFSTVKSFENNAFLCERFVHDPPVTTTASGSGGLGWYTMAFDPLWKRELVREFVWILLLHKKQSAVVPDLIAAMQRLMTTHPSGRQDVFLSALHCGVQGTTNLSLVPCWGLDDRDAHSEDTHQRALAKTCQTL